MDHKTAYELLESYVFGGLEPHETARVEAHLDGGCATCAARLREFSELSVRMAMSVPQHVPPASVKSRLFERIQYESAVAAAPPPRPADSSLLGWLRAAWATSAIAVAAAAFLVVQNARMSGEMGELHARLDIATSETQQLRDELTYYQDRVTLGRPGMRFVSMSGIDPNPNAFGHLVLEPDGRSGIAYLYDFPRQPREKVYQLWGNRHDKPPVSIGTFTVSEDGSAMLRLNKIEDAECITEFEVTIEPADGMPEPTGMTYVRGRNRFWENTH